MPQRKPQTRKRKLPPGVVGMAEWKEAQRLAQVERNRKEFMAAYPTPEARRLWLMDMVGVRVEIKKPGDEPPAE